MKDRLNEMFEYQDGLLIRKVSAGNTKVGGSAGCLRPDGRVQVTVDGKNYLRSRLIWILHHGDIPEGLQVDHIDNTGLKSDDRIENLRLATRSQNKHNTKAKGYSWNKAKGKWEARITHQGKEIYLGSFDCQLEAHAEYLRAKRKYAKEFAPCH